MMNEIRAIWMILLAATTGLFCPGAAMSGHPFDFAVIQPGQPGSPEEARPVMEALANYIQKRVGNRATVRGHYFNELDSAVNFLHNESPAWGIVSLGFYSEQATSFQMTAIAATRPVGYNTDIWRLVVPKDGCTDWKALQGRVLGNMLFEREAAACLLFNVRADQLPFTLEGTFHPLRSLRNVVRGKAAGAVLDRSQHDAVQTLPLAKEITVIHTSGELPASPVVWFGTPDDRTRDLTRILLGMKEDGDAQTLLKLLQTDGFEPADPHLLRYRLDRKGTHCFP